MKFYGNGIVWNPEEENILCRFVKGELETDDESICSKLIERGYKHEPIIEALEIHSDATFTSQEDLFIKEELPFSETEEVTKEVAEVKPKQVRIKSKVRKGGTKK